MNPLSQIVVIRPIWTGAIGFGLVNIPIRLYSATDESSIPFLSLDKHDHARIRYKKVNEQTGKEVAFHDIVKGYQMGKELVIVDEEDIRKATPEKYDHLAIMQFVKEEEIDARYYEKPYYLQPDKGGDRAYVLIREALKKKKEVGIGPMIFHRREWYCLLKPLGEVLVLHRLRFPEEIRDPKEITIPNTPLKEAEMKMAVSLIEQLTKPFSPNDFKDEFSEKLLKVIEAKAKGKGATVKQLKSQASATTIDLMESLKASLKNAPGKKSA